MPHDEVTAPVDTEHWGDVEEEESEEEDSDASDMDEDKDDEGKTADTKHAKRDPDASGVQTPATEGCV